LFLKNCLFKCGEYYIVDPSGKNAYKLFGNKNIDLGNARFSKDDHKICFRGGATFNDSSIISGYNYECQDIFSIDIDGKNLRRLTHFRITSWIMDFFMTDDEQGIILSIEGEDWESDAGKYRKEAAGVRGRYPFKKGLYKYSLKDGTLQPIYFTVETDFMRYNDRGDIFSPLIENAALSPSENYTLFVRYYGILKLDFDNYTINAFVDSVNSEPFPETTGPNKIYNIQFTHDGKKLVGGVGDTDNYQLVLFDIATKTIEKRFKIDPSKIIPYRGGMPERKDAAGNGR